MRPRILAATLGLLCCAGLVVKLHANYPRNQGPTVQVFVQAVDTSGGTLHYQWKSTDGNLISADSPTVTWTLPAGPGLHFAYVLVSNGLGGYTEKRIAVNTDGNGTRVSDDGQVLPYVAPPAPPRQGDTYRSSTAWGLTYVGDLNHDVHAPDVSVYIKDNVTNATYPPTGPVQTDLRGEYVIPNLPPGNNYDTYCQPPGTSAPTVCSAGFFVLDHLTMPNIATSDYLSSFPFFDYSVSDIVSGNVALQDGSPCGTVNEFFGVHSTASATLLDASGNPMGTAVRANELGDFTLIYYYDAMPTSVSVQCEGAPAVVVPSLRRSRAWKTSAPR